MRRTHILLALITVILVIMAGDGHYLLRSLERGLAWGVGREIAHGVFHGQ